MAKTIETSRNGKAPAATKTHPAVERFLRRRTRPKIMRAWITGTQSILLHNGQLADPMNGVVKDMKKITSKKKKSDDDLAELARLEFIGGIYYQIPHSDADNPKATRKVGIPGDNIVAMMVEAARKSRRGGEAEAAIRTMSDSDFWELEYNGPKTLDGLWEAGPWDNGKGFAYTVGAVVMGKRVMRTRCRIRKGWKLYFELEVRNFDQATVEDMLLDASEDVGLCDWRPKFGQFEVNDIQWEEYADE